MTASHLLLTAILSTIVPIACGLVGAGLVDLARDRASEPLVAAPVAAGGAPARAVTPAGILRAWDQRREQAWRAADEEALGRLYLPRSLAGRRDVAMLRQWSARGLRVVELRVEVSSVRVLVRRAARLVVVVTDRVTRAETIGERGGVVLPRDGTDTHRIDLRRVDGRWLVASVRPVRVLERGSVQP